MDLETGERIVLLVQREMESWRQYSYEILHRRPTSVLGNPVSQLRRRNRRARDAGCGSKRGIDARLTPIVEAHFRQVRKLAPSADLKEADLDFPDSHFRLNATYGLTEKSLLFFYNDGLARFGLTVATSNIWQEECAPANNALTQTAARMVH